MTRKQKLIWNSVSSLLHQIIAIVCGFILPRYFLMNYGSAVNGLVSSITQFLGFITLAECGVGAVVQSSLYKPLAIDDMVTVSKIVISSDKFFKRIAYILLGYVFVLATVYPFITIESFDYLFTLLLIIIISISSFAQYYLGMTYRLLLTADQLGFVVYGINTVALVINTMGCVILMQKGASLHAVKLISSMIFVMQPVLIRLIVKKKYKLNRKIKFTEEPIKQKWNGLAQHIATVVLNNTDTVVLTFLSTLQNVSIYAVYHLVVNGVKQIVLSTTNGMQSMLGNMLAKGENDELNRSFDNIEWFLHTIVVFVFSVTAVLIIPFVTVYTADIKDTNYIEPLFAVLISLAQASYCIRLPYNMMVLAAGHYKQTQWSAIIEAGINIFVSVVFVFHFGLVGVAVGTLIAMLYRTVYLALYLRKNIIFRKLRYFVKHIVVDVLIFTLILSVKWIFPNYYLLEEASYFAWIVLALKVGITGAIISAVINFIFYQEKMKNITMIFSRKKP